MDDKQIADTLGIMALAKEVLRESRPMTDWERAQAAEFFWSEVTSGDKHE